jgi:flavin-dependent dehydrogenase
MKLDVAILGGGLAGNFLARQLRRTLPDLRIGLFERTTETSYKVGESTVEISSSYFIRRLGLTRYLYQEHLPKNGLRYFFDDPERSTEIQAMSEIGTVNLPFHPAFQIDRARMEADLLAMNAEDGVLVRTGARVQGLSLGEGGAPHRFEVVQDERKSSWEARWVVDASGRASLLAKKLDLRLPEASHHMGSVWGRFERVTDVDDLGPPAWHERVRYTARALSTMHFCYPGYWIWFIPLRHGVTSVGVTGDERMFDKSMRTQSGFRAFLERHQAVRSLLANAKLVDIGSYARIAYSTQRFFHPDRWALVGEAAAAQDPLYSPGIDFIALANDFTTELVRRDAAGDAHAALAERADLYDRFMRFRHEATMRLYRNLYECLGSYELMRMKWDLDVGSYYNLWVAAYMQNAYMDVAFLEQQLRWQPFLLQSLDNFSRLFRNVERSLRERGAYFRRNLGLFSYGLENIPFVEEIGLRRTQRTMLRTAHELFNVVRQRAIDALEIPAGAPAREPLPFQRFVSDAPLV